MSLRTFIDCPSKLLIIFAIGILARLVFFPVMGFEQDFMFFESWAAYLADHGPVTIYDDPKSLSVGFINYTPLYLYILTVLAKTHRLFYDGSLHTTLFLCLIKTVTLFFEIVSSYVLFRWVKHRWDESTALRAVGFYFLNPAIIYVSAYYGQVDALLAAFLLFTAIALAEDRYFGAGAALACAILMKLQAIPFIPLFFFIPIIRKKFIPLLSMSGGFILVGAAILLPYFIYGKLGNMWNEAVAGSFKWGQFITVGAFNPWYLHADPVTNDIRIVGWFFGYDGQLSSNALLNLFTYKKLGIGLFGVAFLLSLYGLWKRLDRERVLIAASHLALAFYILPTKVHERYLFPFFLLYAALSARLLSRGLAFFVFSMTYLINLMVICPLFGEVRDVREIDSTLGVLCAAVNFVFYVWLVAKEYIAEWWPERRFDIVGKTFVYASLCAIVILVVRYQARRENPNVLYLSHLKPVSAEQEWPMIDPAQLAMNRGKLTGYEQVQRDLSMEGWQIQIGRTVYRYGLGAHAYSKIVYDVPGKYTLFESFIGVDSEVLPIYEEMPDRGTVSFAVWVNGRKEYQSPLILPTTPPLRVVIPLPQPNSGVIRLILEVTNGGDSNRSDHADWALARVIQTRP